ncbi:MAG: hypothetical protein J5I90_05365 [Caldilineales bacterium]|nr:hypothetical protein [Caldilineales bacterium]
MTQNHNRYMSFLLRLWLENDQASQQPGQCRGLWRVSLEDPHTQDMRVFEKLADLFEFLSQETERQALSGVEITPDSLDNICKT